MTSAESGSNPALRALLDRLQGLEGGVNREGFALGPQVVGAGLENDFQKLLFVGLLLRISDVTFALEHPLNRAGLSQIAAVFGEKVADLGNRPVLVVRQAFNKHRRAAGSVSLVRHRFVGLPRQLAGALHDGPFDVVERHVHGLGRRHGSASLGLESASPPPIRAATLISLISFVKILPRFESAAAFLCLIECHFE